MENQLGYEVTLTIPYEAAIDRVTAALKTQGFGVLTRIDVKATLKEKLGVEFRPYVILGACNPPLAHQALELAPELGLMLPCNVTVEAASDQSSVVRIVNPGAMLLAVNAADSAGLNTLAEQATRKMEQVVAALEQN